MNQDCIEIEVLNLIQSNVIDNGTCQKPYQCSLGVDAPMFATAQRGGRTNRAALLSPCTPESRTIRILVAMHHK